MICVHDTASVNDTTQSLVEKVKDCVGNGNKDNEMITNAQSKNVNKTFASTVMKDLVNMDNKLSMIPTEDEEGREVVIFDEEIVVEVCKKWDRKLCVYFVGYKMSYQEIKYNLGRMWGKWGLKDILMQNGTYLFKFNNDEGLNHVLDSGPWMVNNKALLVQKWDPSVCMDKSEPTTLPLWVKLYNMPMEAWCIKGVSAIASSLGKPLIMDKVTTKMCYDGNGRLGLARVLVEVRADKELKKENEICYKNKDLVTTGSKFVKVEYAWTLPTCKKCKVFGHMDSTCPLQPMLVLEKTGVKESNVGKEGVNDTGKNKQTVEGWK